MSISGLKRFLRTHPHFGKLYVYARSIKRLVCPFKTIFGQTGLAQEGWLRSALLMRSVDRQDKPLPWFTYGAIHFLEDRVRSDMRVFEYGSGNSTHWFAKRAREVVSVEHDGDWLNLMKRGNLPSNAKICYRELTSGYPDEITRHGQFDVVVIDGRDRTACFSAALGHLTERGVIVWDNANRNDCRSVVAHMADLGFRELPFVGTGPINPYNWRTSIFYRDQNCFDI